MFPPDSSPIRNLWDGIGRSWFRALLVAVSLLLLGAPIAGSEPLDGDAVLAAARKVLEPISDRTVRVRMTLTKADGSTKSRRLHGREKRGEGELKVLWIFEAPADLQGTGFLAWQKAEQEDKLWVYFPGQRRVRRVPPSLRRERFQGSAFTYEDLTTVFYLDFPGTNRRLEDAPCGETTCQVVETVLPEGRYAYQRVRTWLRAETRVLEKIEFLDEEPFKEFRTLRVEDIDGIPTIVEMEMHHLEDGYRSRLSYDGIEYNQALPDRIFTVKYLGDSGK